MDGPYKCSGGPGCSKFETTYVTSDALKKHIKESTFSPCQDFFPMMLQHNRKILKADLSDLIFTIAAPAGFQPLSDEPSSSECCQNLDLHYRRAKEQCDYWENKFKVCIIRCQSPKYENGF